MFDKIKLFGKQKINKGKIANQIFDRAATPVLVLDEKQELLMANAAAKEFFDLSEEFENVTISSLFEITKEDAKSLFDNIISGFHTEECQIQAQKNGAICKLNTSVIQEDEEELAKQKRKERARLRKKKKAEKRRLAKERLEQYEEDGEDAGTSIEYEEY